MFLTEEEKSIILNAVKLATYNRISIEREGEASCYFCIKRCKAVQIEEYTDKGETALCPHCTIDSLIPGKVHVKVLNLCNEKWFDFKEM